MTMIWLLGRFCALLLQGLMFRETKSHALRHFHISCCKKLSRFMHKRNENLHTPTLAATACFTHVPAQLSTQRSSLFSNVLLWNEVTQESKQRMTKLLYMLWGKWSTGCQSAVQWMGAVWTHKSRSRLTWENPWAAFAPSPSWIVVADTVPIAALLPSCQKFRIR